MFCSEPVSVTEDLMASAAVSTASAAVSAPSATISAAQAAAEEDGLASKYVEIWIG